MIGTAVEAVVIGASAGALEALSAILPKLPRDFRPFLAIVVHVPPDNRSMLATLMQAKSQIRVVEAEDKEPISPSTAYFAPPDYHLLVEDRRALALSSDEPVLFSRPSIDVLFESAADVYGSSLLAIILSGANQDGAAGSKAVVEAGGAVIVQNPDEAFAPAMPEATLEACPGARVMRLREIAEVLQKV